MWLKWIVISGVALIGLRLITKMSNAKRAAKFKAKQAAQESIKVEVEVKDPVKGIFDFPISPVNKVHEVIDPNRYILVDDVKTESIEFEIEAEYAESNIDEMIEMGIEDILNATK